MFNMHPRPVGRTTCEGHGRDMAVNVAHVPIFPESLQVVTWVEKGCIHTEMKDLSTAGHTSLR